MKCYDKCFAYNAPHGLLVIAVINLMANASFVQFSDLTEEYGYNYVWSALSASSSAGYPVLTNFATFPKHY